MFVADGGFRAAVEAIMGLRIGCGHLEMGAALECSVGIGVVPCRVAGADEKQCARACVAYLDLDGLSITAGATNTNIQEFVLKFARLGQWRWTPGYRTPFGLR